MEKNRIIKEVGIKKDFDPDNWPTHRGTPIDDLIDWLKQSKKEGATHIEWGGSSWSDSDEIYEITAQPVYFEIESDDNFQLRLKAEQDRKHLQAQEESQKEIALYKKLKEKYKGI